MIEGSWGTIFEAEMTLVRILAVPSSFVLFAYFNSSLVYPYT